MFSPELYTAPEGGGPAFTPADLVIDDEGDW
jgi:hypothetical protein